MHIREASESDLEIVLKVEREAFGEEDEANLVQNLLSDESAKPTLSLLAFQESQAVGHILFTKAFLEPEAPLAISLLAPLAVIPSSQKQGVGEQLIKYGFQRLCKSKVDLVFVLGYPDYYSRHGFKPAGRLGFEATYPIPDKNVDAWMVLALRPNIIGKYKGKVVCADALKRPEYWIK